MARIVRLPELIFNVILILLYSKELWRADSKPVHAAAQNSEQKRELKRLFKTGVRKSRWSLLLDRIEGWHCFAADAELEMARNLQ